MSHRRNDKGGLVSFWRFLRTLFAPGLCDMCRKRPVEYTEICTEGGISYCAKCWPFQPAESAAATAESEHAATIHNELTKH